jgi:hypothetical protein
LFSSAKSADPKKIFDVSLLRLCILAFARNASATGCNEACAKVAFRCAEDRPLAVQKSAVFPINSRFLHRKTEIQSLRCNSAHPTHEFFATKQFLGQEIVLASPIAKTGPSREIRVPKKQSPEMPLCFLSSKFLETTGVE